MPSSFLRSNSSVRDAAFALLCIAAIGGFFAYFVAHPASAEPERAAFDPSTIQFIRDGQLTEVPHLVPVAGSVVATFSFARGDDRYERLVDVSLLPLSNPTAGVTDATVSAWSIMVMMGHGGVGVPAANQGNGHYLLPMDFTMPGAWQVDITIETGGRQAVISLMIPAFD